MSKKMIGPDDFNEQEHFTLPPPTRKQQVNPLSEYFRLPGPHITLPTRGAFFPEGVYEETLGGDIPVYPMKASDEMLLRSPDAMMSGYALEKLIESCVPNIKDPRLVSTPDLDVILLAIRVATFGEKMEVEVPCPACNTENLFDCHLPSIMGTINYIDPVNEVRLNDSVVVSVRPYNMASATKAALVAFNESRKIQSAEDDEALQKIRNESYQVISKTNLDALSECIISVTTPKGEVTNRQFISEFISNTSQAWIKKIEKKLEELNSKGIDKHIDATCAKCGHKWSPQIEFDPTSFFDPSS